MKNILVLLKLIDYRFELMG